MLSNKDVIALGMMIFALFLGAGNIIFPPMEGYLSGTQWSWAALGFILTGVMMPFVTLVIVAIRGKGEALSKDLPQWAQVMFWVTLYLIIGPTFAAPRVTNVAYEMAWLPLGLSNPENATSHVVFAVGFVLIGMYFMLRKNAMISTIGEVMTPLLLLLLAIVAIRVIQVPLSAVQAPAQAYAQGSPLVIGMVGGYQTMDLLAAMAFGGLVANVMRARQVNDARRVIRYTLKAGMVSLVCLSLLYTSLFYMGATSHAVAQGADNGGQIFSRYVNELFGTAGVWMMSGIVMLANLTTLVGVISSASDYFSRLLPGIRYPVWVVIFTAMTAFVAEMGLTTLLRVTIPALLLIYPVAIMLVVLQFLRPYLGDIKRTYHVVIGVTVLFSAIDSLNNLGWLPASVNSTLSHLPLYQEQLAWLAPALITLLIMFFRGKALKVSSDTRTTGEETA
ncbi:MAG: branched-chain amino acid transport system II carrier protein [Lautropia sp.]|nr:branched-chain amino acid transport system II carrier protein [Lautropia sp.]